MSIVSVIRALALACLLTVSAAASAQQLQQLSIQTSAYVFGKVFPKDGTAFTVPGGATVYAPNYRCCQTPNQTATMDFRAGAGSSLIDPTYDYITSNGSYGIQLEGQAKVDGLDLRGKYLTRTVDGFLGPADAPNGIVQTYVDARWEQKVYVETSLEHPADSFGAILMGFTLHGSFPAVSKSPSNLDLEIANTSISYHARFVDTFGVSHFSRVSNTAYSYAGPWPGSSTKYGKLLFQYGTPFTLSALMYGWTQDNASADFFGTSNISYLELPYGATLQTGAEQAGLGSRSSLYGLVVNSTTLDDPNTNWDFANGGGGFTPPTPVPEAPVPWMLLAGLGVLNLCLRRRSTQRVRGN